MPYTYYQSPIGWLKISTYGRSLSGIAFLRSKPPKDSNQKMNVTLQKCVSEIDEYFQGQRTAFSLPVVSQGSDFQREVMRLVGEIPFGHTVSYSDVARQLGDVNAVRAVGSANGRNKIPIVIPCHRVVDVSGELAGYAGGLWRKKWLIEFETGEKQLDLF